MPKSVRKLPDQATKVLISANPKAGARSGRPVVDRLAELLRDRGFLPVISTDIEEISRESTAALNRGELRAVVAAGGDGTIGLVANHTDENVPLTVLPLGTENLLSKYLGIKPDPESVCETITQGATVRLDAGRVEKQIFLLMVSCGFDADVVRRLHEQRAGHINHLSYAKPILDSIRNYEYPELKIYCDQREISARWGFVFNLPCYAMGLRIAPDADGTDGLLDVCTFKDGSFWSGLKYLSGVVFGQHKTWRDCVIEQAKHIRIESDGEVPFEIDGDPGGFLPVDIEIIPDRLTLVVPEQWAADHGFQSANENN